MIQNWIYCVVLGLRFMRFHQYEKKKHPKDITFLSVFVSFELESINCVSIIYTIYTFLMLNATFIYFYLNYPNPSYYLSIPLKLHSYWPESSAKPFNAKIILIINKKVEKQTKQLYITGKYD